jgi:hypothetical protein
VAFGHFADDDLDGGRAFDLLHTGSTRTSTLLGRSVGLLCQFRRSNVHMILIVELQRWNALEAANQFNLQNMLPWFGDYADRGELATGRLQVADLRDGKDFAVFVMDDGRLHRISLQMSVSTKAYWMVLLEKFMTPM